MTGAVLSTGRGGLGPGLADFGRDAFAPRRPGGTRRGFAYAVVAHLLLVAALTWSVRWKTSEPEGVVAELWAATPQVAAPRAAAVEPPPPVERSRPVEPRPEPRPVEPPPQRIDPQIAIDRAAREKAARQEAERREAVREEEQRERLAEAERKKQEAAKAKQEEARLAATREAQLKRMMAQAGGSEAGPATAPGTAARTAGPSAGYAGRIKARIKPNIVLTGTVSGNPTAEIEVRLAPDGTIVGRKILASSGSPVWDETVLRAIDKTEILPRDIDGRVPPLMVMTFRPLE